MRVVSIILGLLMIIGGAVALFMPSLTFFSLSWLIGICIVIESIGEAVSLIDMRKNGKSSAWGFISAALSLIVGIVLISSTFAQQLLSSVLVYFIAGWIIVLGVLAMLKNKKGSLGWLSVIIGLLMIVFGVMGILSPTIIAISTGIFAGIAVLLSGVGLIATAVSY